MPKARHIARSLRLWDWERQASGCCSSAPGAKSHACCARTHSARGGQHETTFLLPTTGNDSGPAQGDVLRRTAGSYRRLLRTADALPGVSAIAGRSDAGRTPGFSGTPVVARTTAAAI